MRARLTATVLGGTLSALGPAGCGDSERSAPVPVVRAEDVSLVAEPGDRLVVATVNGQPIYADCVERQGAAHGLEARAALDECIDFELLAQAADRAGHRVDADVLDVREREAVRALIDHTFVVSFDSPEDVPMEHVRSYYDEVKYQKFVRLAEWRETQYARIQLARDVAVGSVEDLEAQAIANRIYAAMKHRTDLTADEFLEQARAIAAPTEVGQERSPFSFAKKSGILPVYIDATWEIAEPGMIHAPIRTRFGWDVILLTQILPPKNITIEEAKAEIQQTIYEVSRARSFMAWSNELGSGKPEIDLPMLERLAAAEQSNQAMFGPSEAQAAPPEETGTP